MSKKMKSLLLAPVLALLLTFAAPAVQAQCPMCKAAVTSEHGTEKNELASGLNTGILYLFALPYGSAMVILVSVLVTRRRQMKEKSRSKDKVAQHAPASL